VQRRLSAALRRALAALAAVPSGCTTATQATCQSETSCPAERARH
jgi:hypothetical protein